MSALLEAAHLYRARDWRVIQLHSVGPDGETCSCNRGRNCTSVGKHPIDTAWQESPALSAPDLEALWERRPNANVGLATGRASGFWVLDIDPDNGGHESMQQLVMDHGAGKLPETFVVQTGSGGYHYYFKLPDFELRNSADRVGKGIDTRADGGQVVAAPSRTDKGEYRVIRDVPIVDAPEWLLEMVRKPEVDTSTIVTAEDLPKPEDIPAEEWERLNAYANKAIDAECNRLRAMFKLKTSNPGDYRGEPWNLTTFEVACALLEFQNSPWNGYNSAWQDVMSLAPRDEDFTLDDIEERFASAQRTVGDKARPMPEGRSGEPDPLFSGPDVVARSSNPSEPGEGDAYPYRALFGGEKGTTPQYVEMAQSVIDRGPVGWGHDHDFWSYENGVWRPDHYVVQHRLIEILGDAYRTGHRTNAIDVVQKLAQPITGEPLEPVMNFRNGMLDWRDGVLMDHDPSYGSTVQFGTEWDADATCPHFEEFLCDILHEDYVRLAWEMIGYLMLSGNPLQVAFLFYGKGGNGKGTLINALELLLGKENIASESLDDLTNNKFRTASLFGKIANLAGDIDATYQENTATFKRITGEDMITAEHKGLTPFRFESWAVPVFSANSFPGSSDVTKGYLRRWIILHFDRNVDGSKKVILRNELMGRFTNELPGIATKGVESLRVLMDRKEFNPEGKALEAKEMFAEEIDQVRKWLVSGDVIRTPGAMTPLINLYASYSLWAERSGHRKVRESEFLHRLEALEFQKVYDQGIPNVDGLTVHQGAHETAQGGIF